jgi:hypothetical protein
VVTESTLEAALRDLGRDLAWPETPDLAGAVAERIGRGAEVRPLPGHPIRRSVVLVAAAFLVVLGGMMVLSPGIRAAILRFFSLPGVRIEVQESAPPGSPTVTPSPAAPSVTSFLGRRVGLAEARREVGFPLVVPAALGRPDETYLVGSGEGGMVTLAYRDVPGVPRGEETGWAALLTELRGRPTEQLIRKVTLKTTVTEVAVDGERGYFIEGPHVVYVQGPGAEPASITIAPRTAGNTLLWTRDGVTLRLEANVPLARAMEIARSI